MRVILFFISLLFTIVCNAGKTTTIASKQTELKNPDAVGNLYETEDRKDRKYQSGGRLTEDKTYHYHYDDLGNLIFKEYKEASGYPQIFRSKTLEKEYAVKPKSTATGWLYRWTANGMLREVIRPSGRKVQFEYDALGRRTAKIYNGTITRYLWDGNVMLHEWSYDITERPQLQIGELGELYYNSKEPIENLVTWIYEEGGYTPIGTVKEGRKYSIVSDYMGTPIQGYDIEGNLIWQRELDVYGNPVIGENDFMPFRFQGQYYDSEIDLCYSRFRYYCPNSGAFISQDPIGLAGGGRLYGYVRDSNTWIDPFGLQSLEPIIFLSDGGGVIHPKTTSATNPHGIFTIDATGSHAGDRVALIEKTGFDPYGNYHAHHIDYDPETNTMRMQFVHKDYHSTHSHIGGANDFYENTGFKYNSDEAIAEASKRNKAKLTSGCKR